MVSVHKNVRDNVSTIYVLNYCTHLLMVRDSTLNDIAVNVSLCLLSALMVQPFVVASVRASTTIFGGYL